MPKPVYTHKSLVYIYNKLVTEVGRCALGAWEGQTPNKDWMSDGEYNSLVGRIYQGYTRKVERGEEGFIGKPKSPQAIRLQISWCMTRQSIHNLDRNQMRTMHRNRQAAYEAGFLTQTDILNLEHQQGVL